MESQTSMNYDRIASAIEYINQHFREQPDVDQIAKAVHLSPSHFKRMFADWAGTTPKKFLQYISLEYAKQMLLDKKTTVSDTAFETGFSSGSRLHDLFVNIEGMTPAEYKNGGQFLQINYSFAESPFGALLLASTPKGICHMAFMQEEQQGFFELKAMFPNATLERKIDVLQQNALAIFQKDWFELPDIKLHLKGTAFQLKVWEALLKIPEGHVSTYSDVARRIGAPSASRAVGTAIGSNPVAYLIPCHRVIQASGALGGYRWGPARKAAIIGWEGVKAQ